MENLKPSRVFYYFQKLMEIPRPSGHEKEVSDFLIETGKKLGLKTYQDKALNVILKRDASKGYENSPKVVLQGHMDMVGAKASGSNHDFEKDPIVPVIQDGYLKAKDTTLGADNGIAVAMGLALLEDENYQGPQLELLVTTDEETSMSGALNLEKGVLEGNYLINLDSEEEGILTVGSAGGLTVFIEEDLSQLEEKDGFEVYLHGLKGGHSGMEIDDNRGNSVKILGDFLSMLGEEITIGEFNSGTLDNVIPSEGRVKVFGTTLEKLKEVKEEVIKKYSDVSEEIAIEISESKGESYSKELSQRLIQMIEEMPTGVNSKMDNSDTVESSNNLAFIKQRDNKLLSEISLRSSDNEVLESLRKKIVKVVEKYGFSYRIGSQYPGWEYNEDSKLRPLAQQLYKEMEGKDFETIVVHAGLECGAIYEKYPNMDIISIGPNITGAHSIKEQVEIESVKRVNDYLVELLKRIK
ncbi:beta-Ala-His dipeptidase [Lagierella sp.]|uniref:beta-Ala-His dipeptidase n=1 Tax=Lagierella sp. TaxID=2849657 RepID=UPI00261D0D7C|nr:beta-Ala-His dipeptidase [Lagierella sp.]